MFLILFFLPFFVTGNICHLLCPPNTIMFPCLTWCLFHNYNISTIHTITQDHSQLKQTLSNTKLELELLKDNEQTLLEELQTRDFTLGLLTNQESVMSNHIANLIEQQKETIKTYHTEGQLLKNELVQLKKYRRHMTKFKSYKLFVLPITIIIIIFSRYK